MPKLDKTLQIEIPKELTQAIKTNEYGEMYLLGKGKTLFLDSNLNDSHAVRLGRVKIVQNKFVIPSAIRDVMGFKSDVNYAIFLKDNKISFRKY